MPLLADPEARVRRRAALAIGRVRLPEGIDPLRPVLASDADPEVRQMAAFALGLIGDAQAADALASALVDADPVVQGRAAEALGAIGHRPSAPTLGTLLRGYLSAGALQGITADHAGPPPTPAGEAARLTIYALVRLQAIDELSGALIDSSGRPVTDWWPVAYAFGRAGSPAGAAPLRQLLSSQGQMTRAFAARGLGMLKDREAVPALMKLLQAQQPLPVRVQAVRALGVIGEPQAAAAIANALRIAPERQTSVGNGGKARAQAASPPAPVIDRSLQLEMVTALGTLRAAGETDVLLDLASDQWPAMRAAALTALAQADPDLFFSSLSGLDPDPHWSVRAAIAAALGGLDLERAEPQLTTLLADSDQRVLPAVLDALVASKAPSAVPVLFERLRADDFVLRKSAAAGLAQLKPAGARDALVTALNEAIEKDSTYVARAAMLEALVEIDRSSALPLLERALGDKDWAVRLRAAEWLRRAAPEQPAQPLRPAPASPVAEANALDTLIAPPFSPVAYIDTDAGMIQVELAVLDAPRTAANFIALAGKGFFNASPIHRVVPDFVVQDGDPRGDGDGGPGYTIRDEINQRPYERGSVGMALDWADTGGSQFFITHSPQPHLDGRYTVFGRVTDGMDVVDRLAKWSVIRSVRVWDGTRWIGP